MDELFDCHVHLGASDTGELYYGHLRGEEYLDLMAEGGVGRALAFPPLLAAGYAQANRALARWCAGTAGKVRPLARIGGRQIGLTEPRVWLLRRKLGRLARPRAPDLRPEELVDFAGLKLLPHLDGLPDPDILQATNDLKLPILTHAGRFVGAGWLAKALLPRIETKLVLAHLGAFPDRQADLEAAVELAASDRRVYLDTSGIWIADFLTYAIANVPNKLLFGSDCPLTTPAVAWQMIERCTSDPGLRRRIGSEAALEVFG